MLKNQFEEKSMHNVHKVAFLLNEFPDLDIAGVTKMFQLSSIELNVAIWRAQDVGIFTVDEKGKATIHDLPKDWELGDTIGLLMEHTLYTLARIAVDETDLVENTFLNWFGGYATQDVMICMKHLINQKKIFTYELNDKQVKEQTKKQKGKGAKLEYIDNVYTFYTLYENREMRWGTKSFKDPKKLQ